MIVQKTDPLTKYPYGKSAPGFQCACHLTVLLSDHCRLKFKDELSCDRQTI